MGSDISHDDNVPHDAPYTKLRYRSFKAYIGSYLSSVLNLQDACAPTFTLISCHSLIHLKAGRCFLGFVCSLPSFSYTRTNIAIFLKFISALWHWGNLCPNSEKGQRGNMCLVQWWHGPSDWSWVGIQRCHNWLTSPFYDTERPQIACMWFGEICLFCCLPPLPQLSCSILPTMCEPSTGVG